MADKKVEQTVEQKTQQAEKNAEKKKVNIWPSFRKGLAVAGKVAGKIILYGGTLAMTGIAYGMYRDNHRSTKAFLNELNEDCPLLEDSRQAEYYSDETTLEPEGNPEE